MHRIASLMSACGVAYVDGLKLDSPAEIDSGILVADVTQPVLQDNLLQEETARSTGYSKQHVLDGRVPLVNISVTDI